MSKPLRICMIGCGHIAQTAYVPALRRYQAEHGGLELAACCDRDPTKAQRIADLAGFSTACTEYEQMLGETRPDAVLLTVPFQVMAPIAIDILRRDIPLLMEKPPGNNLGESLEIADMAAETGTPHQVAFNRRHMPLVTMLLADMRKNSDTIRHIDYLMYRFGRSEDYFHTTAIHGIDLVAYLTGSSYESAHFLYGEGRSMLAQCALENGATAQLSFCPMAGEVFERFSVVTAQASYQVDLPVWNTDGATGTLTKHIDGEQIFRREGPCTAPEDQFTDSNGFYAQLESFFDCVKAGSPMRDTVDTALTAMAVADALSKREKAYAAQGADRRT